MTGRVLVTGASRGIGRAIALDLARAGFDIVVHYRSQEAAAAAVAADIEAMGRAASLISFDVADRTEARRLLEAEIESGGAFYGVVCNAGLHSDAAFPAMTGAEWDGVVAANLTGFYNVLHPVVMPMIRMRRGGRIVAISSVAGIMGNRGQANYSAAKAGLIGAAKALAVELASRRITVNCVAPGLIETDMTDGFDQARLEEMVPARRFGRAEEVASLVTYLFKDEAGYITRQVISVNGGMF